MLSLIIPMYNEEKILPDTLKTLSDYMQRNFDDYEIPEDSLNCSRSIAVTGIVTLYQGSVQFVINSYDDIRYSDTGKTLPRQ